MGQRRSAVSPCMMFRNFQLEWEKKMITILSPAKSLDYESQRTMPPATRPRLMEATSELVARAQGMTQAEIGALMHISDALAQLNHERYQGFDSLPERPAIQAFNGDVYDGLDAKIMDDDALLYAQDHLRILSGLYGLLRPLDLMKPYRLEMGTKRFPGEHKLSIWWERRVADLLASDVAESGSATILNLASQEYYASVKGRLPKDIRVVDVEFLAADGRMITFHAKTARGVMARWMIANRINDVEDMRSFDAAGYAFDHEESSCDQWIFRRAADQVGPPY